MLCASSEVQSSTEEAVCAALWYKVVMVVVCASFVLQSSTGKCFVQTLKCTGVWSEESV